MTLFESIFNYFKDIGLSSSFKETVELILDDSSVILEGGPLNRLKQDKLPALGWLSEDSEQVLDKFKYYKTDLFVKVRKANNSNFRSFYKALSDGMLRYTESSPSSDVPKKLQSARHAATQIHHHLEAQILSPLSQTNDCELFANVLYTVLHFIANGYIWQSFSEAINGLEKDRLEFDNEVISKFGCSGKPGMYAVYRLADKKNPNAIALFEAGELEYYGKGTSSTPDFDKAYQYYKMAVDGNSYNPLAGWSMGYILYYYKNDNKELKDAFIPEIDMIPEEYRKILSIDYLKLSFECGCSAAANVLASVVADDSIADAHKEGLLSQEEYLIIGSKNDYVFAKNNLYSLYLTKANNTDNPEEKALYLKKAYKELKESADLGEPWAINKFALYLYDSGEYESAYAYFKKGHRFLNDWCTYNLLEKYYLVNDMQIRFPFVENANQEFIEKMKTRCLQSANKTIVDNTSRLLKKKHK